MTLVSVQAFGLANPGGGPRILRALYADAPMAVLNVATQPRVPDPTPRHDQIHVPVRPALGRLEGTRAMPLSRPLDLALAPLLGRRLRALYAQREAWAVHAVAHELEFWPAFCSARAARLPFFLSVHDDLNYNYKGATLSAALARLGRVWQGAEHRFVISEPMGEECCARHGRRPYSLVTDGLRGSAIGTPQPLLGLRVYFAGLFHRSYTPNLPRLAQALKNLHDQDRSREVGLTFRAGSLPVAVDGAVPLTTLPFGDEQDVQNDLAQADLLYLPMPFEEAFSSLVDFSLSTKLITYLGSGRPILYHGPPRGAAHDLLARHDAAIMATSQDPGVIEEAIARGVTRSQSIVNNALALARTDFLLDEQRRRFWNPILAATESAGRGRALARDR